MEANKAFKEQQNKAASKARSCFRKSLNIEDVMAYEQGALKPPERNCRCGRTFYSARNTKCERCRAVASAWRDSQ